MIEEPPPAPPPNSPGEKKGLSPLAWAGIGCGGLAVITIVAAVVLIGMGVRKAKEFAEDPSKLAAWVVESDPNLDVVSTDLEGGTITIKEKDTGKETTLSFEDISQGQFSVETSDGESTMIGQVDEPELPGWLPSYPNATATRGLVSHSSVTGTNGSFTVTTPDAPATVADHYMTALEQDGYDITDSSASNGGVKQRILNAKATDPDRQLAIVILSEGAETSATVNYTGPPEP